MWICSARSFLLMPPPCKQMKTLIRIRIQSGKIGEASLLRRFPQAFFQETLTLLEFSFLRRRNENSSKVRSSWRGVRGDPSYKKVLPDYSSK